MKMPPHIATKFTKLVLTILAITILGIILSFVSQDHTLLMLCLLYTSKMIQIRLTRKEKPPPPYTTSFPNGKKARLANLKHCRPTGRPMMVMHQRQPASTQASPPINPPNRNQRIFPIVEDVYKRQSPLPISIARIHSTIRRRQRNTALCCQRR